MAKKKKTVRRGLAFGFRPGLFAVTLVTAAAIIAAGVLLDESPWAHLGGTASASDSGLRLSEVQNHNVLTLLNASGSAASWIEVENAGDAAVSLHGVCLAKDTRFNKTFVFPDITLQPGEFALVYADGRASASPAGELHAAFGLPAAGGTELYLFDAAQQLLDATRVPGMAADESWCRDADGEWQVSATATPGAANRFADQRGLDVQDGEVELSEIMSANVTAFPDEDGAYHDYIEVHNRTDREVSLAGYWLSDNAAKPNKWQFPDVRLPADGYLAVHCSGTSRKEDASHLHAGFKLSAGETVYLAGSDGTTISVVTVPELASGQPLSRSPEGWTKALGPTPNLENTAEAAMRYDAQLRAQRGGGLIISEVMALPEGGQPDWIEIYNGTDAPADLGGWGLSNRADHPRKWQFPAGTALGPGEYLAVLLIGETGEYGGSYLSAPFALSGEGGSTVCLCDGQGVIRDAMFLPRQYGGISYGRDGEGTCGFFAAPTPMAAPSARALADRTGDVRFSEAGGLFTAGQSLSVTLSADPGARIYYTLDCTDPTEASTPYDGAPIGVTGTTIIRAAAFREGCLPSQMGAASYLFDVNAASEAPYVVSLVSDPAGLYSDETGIMVMGPNATDKFPYGDYGRGANFWMDWEREAHVELFTGAGEQAISQECGIKLHGRNTRAYELKSFKVMAKSRYGKNRFSYPIFHDRPWDDYEAFILRYSGQDYKSTFMRDAVLTSLAENTSVMYLEAEECICYLNGKYYSAMYIRENVSPYSLARREGWDGQEDALDLVKSGYEVKQGSNESYIALKAWLDSHDTSTQEAYEVIDAAVDIDNFIEYATLQLYIEPPDTVNVKRYRNTRADGKWRWVIYDVDRGMRGDEDGFALLAQGTNAQLFKACMNNPAIRERLLANLNTALATYLSSEHVTALVDEQFQRLKPLLPDYLEMMGLSQSHYASALKSLRGAIGKRPRLVLKHCADYLNLTQEDVYRLFPDAIAAIEAYEAKAN
ncbi:MAG: lamin tail domain-containing protein [Clostridia bacterium]|nr:lamin tail domain-containing protein [Clostridia bacterium]